MATRIKIKRNASPGAIPQIYDLVPGELAMNIYDGRLFFKKNVNGVESLVTLSGNYADLTNKPVLDLNSLTNVSVSGLASGQVLKWNGSAWSNATDLTSTATSGVSTSTRSVFLYQDGSLTLKTGTIRWYATDPLIIYKIIGRLASSADSYVSVDTRLNGVTTSTLTILASTVKTEINVNINMVVDDYLTVDVSHIGSAFQPGVGLSVEYKYRLL
jgi:hypothetical protein